MVLLLSWNLEKLSKIKLQLHRDALFSLIFHVRNGHFLLPKAALVLNQYQFTAVPEANTSAEQNGPLGGTLDFQNKW